MKKIFFTFIFCIGFYFLSQHFFSKTIVDLTSTQNLWPIEISISNQDTSKTLSKSLEEQGVVKSRHIFTYSLMKNNVASKLKPGKYIVQPNISLDDLSQSIAMEYGERTQNSDVVRVTIPEGFTINQMADRFEEYGVVSKADFLQAVATWESDKWFLAEMPVDGMKLEGYLYPDTYEFHVNSKPQEVINKMLTRFEELVLPLKSSITQKNLSISEVITIASLIEKEAKHNEDRNKISSVIYNRLSLDMMLQIDASILYATGHKDRVTNEELSVDSPYNLYKHKGLPPTPIASPSINSIKAAISPAETEYMYYVANPTTGYHVFSTSYDEHLRNVDKYLRPHQ